MVLGKTTKSILISCGVRLAPFDIPQVRELMTADELSIDTVGDKKTALFIVISDTNPAFNFIPALLYTQMFNLLCEKADSQGGRLKYHTRLMLDEFANIGEIPEFDRVVSTIRSREISATIVLQTLSQLKVIYKEAADTIVGNMDSVLFLGGKEQGTLEDLSKVLGKETIDNMNFSHTRGWQQSGTQNYQTLGRELMSIDELSVMPGDECILQVRGLPPFKSKKYNPKEHCNYQFLADANAKYAYSGKLQKQYIKITQPGYAITGVSTDGKTAKVNFVEEKK